MASLFASLSPRSGLKHWVELMKIIRHEQSRLRARQQNRKRAANKEEEVSSLMIQRSISGERKVDVMWLQEDRQDQEQRKRSRNWRGRHLQWTMKEHFVETRDVKRERREAWKMSQIIWSHFDLSFPSIYPWSMDGSLRIAFKCQLTNPCCGSIK